MKATFHCSTLEQVHDVVRFAHKDDLWADAEVFVDLAGEPVEVKWTVQSHGLKNDCVDAMLPQSFFGAVGTKYLNTENAGKRLAYKLTSCLGNSAVLGRLKRIESGQGCLEAQVTVDSGVVRYLRFDEYDFVFLE